MQVEEPKEEVDEIFTIVEESAAPKGGMAAFYKYVSDKIKYPAQARRMGIEGRVFVEFVINKDGSISDVRAVKGWIYVLVTGVLFYIILRRHIMKLRQAEQKAIESDRLKSAFLANISHEVRTPMNGILGFLDMLKDPDLSTETKRDYIELLERSGYRLITVMTDILDISAIQSETVNPEKRTTDVIQIFEESADFYKSDLETKGLKLNFIKPYGDSPLLIETDEKLLKKIICKLLGNSIKFSDKGEIDLGYEINAWVS